MAQGRIKENDTILDKWVMTCYETPSKPELGSKSVWHFDRSKNSHGCYKVEHTPAKGEKQPKIQVNKTQTYGGVPVGMVFKHLKMLTLKLKLKFGITQILITLLLKINSQVCLIKQLYLS